MTSLYDKIRQKSMERTLESSHEFLVKGSDLEACLTSIRSFLKNYELLRFSKVEIYGGEPLPATSPDFWGRLDRCLAENHRRVRTFLDELRSEGVADLTDLENLPQGHQSNALHTVAHLLDGFFGIDSYFFNLAEETHWLSDELRNVIKSEPEGFMLLPVKGSF